jgi:L-arabinokinase
VLAASDAVISKLGYGTVSACVANRTAILFPAREGFREDALLREGATRFLRAQELPLQDFLTGAWGPHLRALQALREPVERLELNGADLCADILATKMQECS